MLKARREAAAARVLVANHHLLFADLALRLAGTGFEDPAVLPPFQRIIFDEAHNVEKAATSFFSPPSTAPWWRSTPAGCTGRKGKVMACCWGWKGYCRGSRPRACGGPCKAVVTARRGSLEEAARPLLAGRQACAFGAGGSGACSGSPGPMLARRSPSWRPVRPAGRGGREAEADNYFLCECRIQLDAWPGWRRSPSASRGAGSPAAEVFWLEGRKDRLGQPSVRFLITPL